MKKYLLDLIARKKKEIEELTSRMKGSEDLNEVRSLGDMLLKLRDEITDAEKQLAELEKEDNKEPENNEPNAPDPNEGEERGKAHNPQGLSPLSAMGAGNKEPASRSESKRATMEYRMAFKEFYQRGTVSPILEYRADGVTTADKLGVLLPETVVQEIIKGVEKIYGQLYSDVKKTNLKGGVKYPIGSFGAVFHRITETGAPTARQDAGAITGYVEFSYKIGEVRIAQTLLQQVLSVDVFEQELSKTIVEAYVKAMDEEILNGDPANNQMEGIFTEAKKANSRIPAENIIEFTEDEMQDWKNWQKNLFAKIPLSMRSLSPKFVMTPATYEANIKTLVDDNNRPVYNETFNPVDGAERATFKGKEVVFVEEGLGIETFDDASAGDCFALYWVPEKAYAINTNLEFAVKNYFDEEKLQNVTRAVVINDGKVLDPKYIYILRKKDGSATPTI